MGLIESTESDNMQERENSLENKDIQLADVLILLANFHNSNVPIPLQLMVEVLNYAGILSPLRKCRDTPFTSGNNCEEAYLAVNLRNCRYIEPTGVRLVVNSKDQGWSSYPSQRGTRTSWTWGELRFGSNPNESFTVFRNIHAGREYELQEIDVAQAPEVSAEQYQALRTKLAAVRNEPLTLVLVLRSMYPNWTISINHAELIVSYQLAGDFESFVARYRRCSENAL